MEKTTQQIEYLQEVRFAADPELLTAIRATLTIGRTELDPDELAGMEKRFLLGVEALFWLREIPDLGPRHVATLQASAIAPAVAASRGYRTITDATSERMGL